MFDELYRTRTDEVAAFGEHWCGPESLAHGVETLIAEYAGEGDGHHVKVYCCAMPARFYDIRALETTNSVGEPRPAFTLGTSSGMAVLTAQIAKAISEGMLGINSPDQ